MRSWIMWVALLGVPTMAEATCQIAASARTGAFMKVPIREAPTSSSDVLDVAPEFRDAASGAILGARFTVIEMRNGFAHVTGVTDWSKAVSVSDGWINMQDIVVRPQTLRAFAVDSPSSKVMWEGTAWPQAEGLVDCKGEWGKVTIAGSDGAQRVTGWVRGFCDDQAATCEGVTGD